MKTCYAALLAAFFLFTAVGCAAKPAAEPPAEPAVTEPQSAPNVQEPAPEPTAPEPQPQPEPETETEPEPLPAAWQDAPHTEQLDLEEVVSCSYTLPQLTLATDEATATANAVFATLEETIVTYAQQTVYPAAQEKQAMGFVNGGYTIEEADDTLILVYTISVSFSTETNDTRFDHSYTLSLTTGELLKEA